ncbi:MAG TPA: histidine--tRNA ligase [Spirochaetes bacterium]|nr:histidine--tRNA ligase [Spirochaetota bacterium]
METRLMKVDLSVRGMRDYFPEIYYRLNRIFRVWRETALSYGFEEFDGPVIETLDLYRIKSGEEIVKQLYNFTDKGGRELALRPELTPTIARMVSRIQNEVPKPIKWFSIPRCMRYEKPQKGRLREFFQYNVDIIGEDEGIADVEVISVAVDSLCRLGLSEKDFVVRINNRNFVSGYFSSLGFDKRITGALYKIIDNAAKVNSETTSSALEELGLYRAQNEAVRKYLSLKSAGDLKTFEVTNSGKEALLNVFSLLEAAEINEFCAFDPTVVRGLDYYTGTVFEIFGRSEKMRAICGGGRYNNLLKEFSGVDIPACGFGMGDVVLGEILAEKGLVPPYEKSIDYFIVRVTDNELDLTLKIARSLRNRGRRVEYNYKLIPVKKQMARASRVRSAKVLILGADEISTGTVVEKDLATGVEAETPIKSFFE